MPRASAGGQGSLIHSLFATVAVGVLTVGSGCNTGGQSPVAAPAQSAAVPAAGGQPAAGNPAPEPVKPSPALQITVPTGAVLRVRLNHAVSTETSRPGERFTGTLDADVVKDGRIVLPKGTEVRGAIKESDDSGRLRGRAVLALSVDSVVWQGRTYDVATDTLRRVSADHKKRNTVLVGGGSGVGALIGGIAGGGRGALIGAGAGAAAGTAGAAATGKRQVRIPAESVLGFRLREPLRIEG